MEEIQKGDYIISEITYKVQGIVLTKGFLGKMPAYKIRTPNDKIDAIEVNDAKILYTKEMMSEEKCRCKRVLEREEEEQW